MFLATEWGEAKGGANALNQDLVTHCGLASGGKYRISCAVIDATPDSIEKARENGVELISLREKAGASSFENEESEKILAFLEKDKKRCDFVVGHDIFTGPVAVALARRSKGKCGIFIHSKYASYKAAQDRGEAGNSLKKEAVQEQIVKEADFVFGVGPLLTDAAHDMDGSETKKRRRRIKNFIPGIPDISTHRLGWGVSAMCFGRFDDERNEIVKQPHLAIAGYCKFAKELSASTHDPALIIVGLSGDLEKRNAQNARIEALVGEYYDGAIPVKGIEFLPREIAWERLKRSHFSLMLSWREGFGLVGWEAIAAGVPLLMSEQAGLCRHLSEKHSQLKGLYRSIPIRGWYDGLNDGDVSAVADALRKMYGEEEQLRSNARFLRAQLRSRYSWKRQAKRFMRMLDSKVFRFGPAEIRKRAG